MLAPLWLCALAAAAQWLPPSFDLLPQRGVYRWLVQSDDPDLRQRLHGHLEKAGARPEPDELPYTVFSVPAGRGLALAKELRRYGPGIAAFQDGRPCPKKERARVQGLLKLLGPETAALEEAGRSLESTRRLAEAWLGMYKEFDGRCAAAARDLVMVGLSDRAPAPRVEPGFMTRPVGPPLVPPKQAPNAPYPDWEGPTPSCGWPSAVVEIQVTARKGGRAAYNYELEEGFRRLGLTAAATGCARSLGLEMPSNARLAAAMTGSGDLERLRAYAKELGWTKETVHRIKRDNVPQTPSSRWRAALAAELAENDLSGYPNVRSLAKQEIAALKEYDVPSAPGREALAVLVILP